MNEDTVHVPDEPTPEAAADTPRRASLLRNYISFIGIAIAAASLTSIALLILIELSSPTSDNPYTVLVTYILLPAILVFGIFLILVGMLI